MVLRYKPYIISLIIGIVFALTLQTIRITAEDGWYDLLIHIPDSDPLRSYFTSEFKRPLTPRETKHDGVASYVVAKDPFSSPPDEIGEVFYWPYRYRRVLYPLIGGLGGTLSPIGILMGLMLTSGLGVGLILAAIRRYYDSNFHYVKLITVWTLIQPGVLYSTILLTPDTLALGLGLLGITFWRERLSLLSWLTLALACLCKETSALFVVGILLYETVHHRETAIKKWLLYGSTLLPLFIWCLYVNIAVGDPFVSSGRFSFTLSGLRTLPGVIAYQSTSEGALLLLTLAGLVFSIFAVFRAPDIRMRYLLTPWTLIAIFASSELWHYGNSSIRIFLPLFLFSMMGFFPPDGRIRQSTL